MPSSTTRPRRRVPREAPRPPSVVVEARNLLAAVDKGRVLAYAAPEVAALRKAVDRAERARPEVAEREVTVSHHPWTPCGPIYRYRDRAGHEQAAVYGVPLTDLGDFDWLESGAVYRVTVERIRRGRRCPNHGRRR